MRISDWSSDVCFSDLALQRHGIAMTSAIEPSRCSPLRLALAVAFLVAVVVFAWLSFGHISMTLVVAAGIGAYMAMNIGANDVANNVGPAVGARAMTMVVAIIIAAIFEALGAVVAGGAVVSTIKSGVINPAHIGDSMTFVWLLMEALLAGALWLNLATWMGEPVSTTNSIAGGVLGAGVSAAGGEDRKSVVWGKS